MGLVIQYCQTHRLYLFSRIPSASWPTPSRGTVLLATCSTHCRESQSVPHSTQLFSVNHCHLLTTSYLVHTHTHTRYCSPVVHHCTHTHTSLFPRVQAPPWSTTIRVCPGAGSTVPEAHVSQWIRLCSVHWCPRRCQVVATLQTIRCMYCQYHGHLIGGGFPFL